MGYIKHNAIVVIGDENKINQAYDEIVKLIMEYDENYLPLLTPVQETYKNFYYSFAFLPDGSKEAWSESDNGDVIRYKICNVLNKLRIDYIDVAFGGDDNRVSIITNEWRYNDE